MIRAAAGATTTEPTADLVDQLFTPSNLVTAGGGGGTICGGLNSIGSAPSSLLEPERGVDEELAFGHRFSQDSQVQLEFSAQAGSALFSRDSNIQPTLHTVEGAQVAVMVEHDIPVRPWAAR